MIMAAVCLVVLSSKVVFGMSRMPSTDYHVKDLGCYDSGGEAEHDDGAGERLRVRENRDAV